MMNLKWSLDLRGMKLGEKGNERLADGIRKGLLKGSAILIGKLKRVTTAGPVHSRTGNLKNSWVETHMQDHGGGVYSIGVGANADKRTGRRVPYANILDEGGVIKPQGHPYLSIPIFDSVTEGGATRVGFEGPREAAATLGQDVFFIKNARGDAYMGIAGKDGKFHAYFALKKSVTIPATHYKDEAIALATDRVTAAMTGEIDKVMKTL